MYRVKSISGRDIWNLASLQGEIEEEPAQGFSPTGSRGSSWFPAITSIHGDPPASTPIMVCSSSFFILGLSWYSVSGHARF